MLNNHCKQTKPIQKFKKKNLYTSNKNTTFAHVLGNVQK